MDIRAYIESGQIEACLTGDASAWEMEQFARLRTEHPEVDQAASEAEAALEVMAMNMAVTPAPHLREQILHAAKASAESKARPETSPTPGFSWINIAAAVLLLAVFSAGIWINSLRDEVAGLRDRISVLETDNSVLANKASQFESEATDVKSQRDLLADAATKRIPMAPPGTETPNADVFWNADAGEVFIRQQSLPSIASNEQFQLWGLRGDEKIDLGVFDHVDSSGDTLLRMKTIDAVDGFAVTIEPRGGSTVPTLEKLVTLGLI